MKMCNIVCFAMLEEIIECIGVICRYVDTSRSL